MGEDPARAEASGLLAAGAAGAGGPSDAAIDLVRIRAPRLPLRAVRVPALGAGAGYGALSAMLLGAAATVLFASAGSVVLVARARSLFPAWEAGPLRLLGFAPSVSTSAGQLGDSIFLLAMTAAYAVAILAARSLSMRAIAIWILAVAVVLLLGPPLQLTDLYNYLGYARLGALHHLNPYTHVIAAETWDPIYGLTSWHNLSSPYGPLFTAITYPLAFIPIPVAYWLLKTLIVGVSLAFVWTVWKCARLLGSDPRPAVLFVAANPIYIFYGVGAFHNDFFVLLPSTAAVALLLSRRDRSAGAVLALAVAVKLSAIVLLPFMLIGARPAVRRLRVLQGFALAGVPLAAMSLVLFGLALPNLAEQSSVVTGFSVPNLVGLALGLGGSTPGLLRVANLALVAVVLLSLRRPREWIAGSGWSTLALIASIGWLMPWYIVWVLPLAALGSSVRLRRAALAFTVFLVLTFMPEMGVLTSEYGLNPQSTATGQAAVAAQLKLQN
ncbi:MAG: glycosyltransferase 87 family protein [Solirubrobacteraceae bacterium]